MFKYNICNLLSTGTWGWAEQVWASPPELSPTAGFRTTLLLLRLHHPGGDCYLPMEKDGCTTASTSASGTLGSCTYSCSTMPVEKEDGHATDHYPHGCPEVYYPEKPHYNS